MDNFDCEVVAIVKQQVPRMLGCTDATNLSAEPVVLLRGDPPPIDTRRGCFTVLFEAADRRRDRDHRSENEAPLIVERINAGIAHFDWMPMSVQAAIRYVSVSKHVARPAAEIDEILR